MFEIKTAVKREKRFSEMLTALKGGTEASDYKAFKTLKDILSFAAFYAFENSLSPKVLDRTGEIEDIAATEYIRDEPNYKAIASIALAATNKIEILKKENQKEMVEVFEKFANAGLYAIEEIYKKNNEYVYPTIQEISLKLLKIETTPGAKPRIF